MPFFEQLYLAKKRKGDKCDALGFDFRTVGPISGLFACAVAPVQGLKGVGIKIVQEDVHEDAPLTPSDGPRYSRRM